MVKKSSKFMTPQEAELIDKGIFLLLAANNNDPIKGRIRFTKDFFLIARKFIPKLFDVSEFYPYHFGPYSTRMSVRVNELKNQGYIIATLSNQDWQYSLTEDGKIKAKSHLKTISQDILQKINEIKIKNKRISLKELLKEIYLYYPEFMKRSILAKDVVKEQVNLDKLQKVDDGPGFVASTSPDKREFVLKGKDAQRFFKLMSE